MPARAASPCLARVVPKPAHSLRRNNLPLGEETLDVYLNAGCYWKNVPRPVWDFTLGGYQVPKKWLSYRELELLGRPLSADEALEFTWMVRRIAALILMDAALDENYRSCTAHFIDLPQNRQGEAGHHGRRSRSSPAEL